MIFKTSSVGGTTFHTLLNDQIISKSLEIYGEWSFGEVRLLARIVAQDANVIELGANIGSHTVFLGKSICPKGKIYAFEPRRLYFQTLCANLIANGVTNVHAFQMGAAETSQLLREGAIPTNVGINAGGFALGDLSGSEEEIDLIALDDRLESFPSVSLIKADIEGYELSALKGASALIKRDRPLLYLEANKDPRTPPLLQHLVKLDYVSWWHTPPYYRRNNRGGSFVNIFGEMRSYNVIACPKEKQATLPSNWSESLGLVPVDDPNWHPAQKI